MNKKKLIPVIIVGAVIGAVIGFFFSSGSPNNTSKINEKNNTQVSINITNADKVEKPVDNIVLVAPELVKVPNVENNPVEIVKLEVGVNGNQSNSINNEMIENIIQLVGSGFLKEAKAEAENSLRNATETKIVTIEVLESTIKTR